MEYKGKRDCHAPKAVLAMTEKDERYKRIMRLPHFLRKFAMTEKGRKTKRITKDGFPFSREWQRSNRNGKKLTEWHKWWIARDTTKGRGS